MLPFPPSTFLEAAMVAFLSISFFLSSVRAAGEKRGEKRERERERKKKNNNNNIPSDFWFLCATMPGMASSGVALET